MASARVRPRDTVGGLPSPMGSRALLACAATGLVPLPPVDGSSFPPPPSRGRTRLAPGGQRCRNTPRVVAALREHASGIRPRVSSSWITDGDGRRVRYTMITGRRKKKSRRGRRMAPEGVYVAFAASRPGIRVNKRYRKRWTTGTGYRAIRRAMTGTHPRSETAGNPCLVPSLAAHNA